MPVYTYRREDGTTFDYRQKFTDDALTVDPETGQKVVRVVQAAGVIFKGSGFYVNDSKNASRKSINSTPKTETKTDSASNTSESAASTTKAEKTATPAPTASAD